MKRKCNRKKEEKEKIRKGDHVEDKIRKRSLNNSDKRKDRRVSRKWREENKSVKKRKRSIG